MDYEAWKVDLKRLTASHDSGFTLQWEGRAQDPSAIHPGKFSNKLSAIEQVRLLRYGVECIAAAAKQAVEPARSRLVPSAKSGRNVLSLKSRTVEKA